MFFYIINKFFDFILLKVRKSSIETTIRISIGIVLCILFVIKYFHIVVYKGEKSSSEILSRVIRIENVLIGADLLDLTNLQIEGKMNLWIVHVLNSIKNYFLQMNLLFFLNLLY